MACQGCSLQEITAKFCTNCGEDLTSQHIVCPNTACGYSYMATRTRFAYCPKCGARMACEGDS